MRTYRGYTNGLVVIGSGNSIDEFIKNQHGFKLENVHEVELILGEWRAK